MGQANLLGVLDRNPSPPLFYRRAFSEAMSVVGVDFGTLATTIAVARNRGVDVVRTLVCSNKQGGE